LVNVADCPEVFYSLRKKVRTAPLQEGQTSELGMSKFGDEKTHICYLGESKSVATVQIKITRRRIRELQDKVKKMQLDPSSPKVSTSKFRPGTDDRTNYKSTSSVFRFCMITSRRWRAKKSEISMAIHSSSMQITRIKIVKLGKHSRMSYMYIVRVST
jgi:L-lactate utilization protein LutB